MKQWFQKAYRKLKRDDYSAGSPGRIEEYAKLGKKNLLEIARKMKVAREARGFESERALHEYRAVIGAIRLLEVPGEEKEADKVAIGSILRYKQGLAGFDTTYALLKEGRVVGLTDEGEYAFEWLLEGGIVAEMDRDEAHDKHISGEQVKMWTPKL